MPGVRGDQSRLHVRRMRVVVVGSGLGGVTVAEVLAKTHQVDLVTAETHGYYSRPRLSHGFSSDAKIVLKDFEQLAPVRVTAGVQVEEIDRQSQSVRLQGGKPLHYDILVLATGSAARIPPALAVFRPQFFTLNSLDDVLTLRRRRQKALDQGRRPRWAIIGGGLIGCELASDLDKAGDAVTIFQREARLLELVFDEHESQALHEHFAARGIELRYHQDVREIFPRTLFDGVIVSAGFAPRVELAREAGLAAARGIVVNPYLRTDDPAIYAVGDVAEIAGRLYPFVSPIRSQALWLAEHLARRNEAPWTPPAFTPVVKIHGFAVRRQPVAIRGEQAARNDARQAPAGWLG
jgi:NAD(P)H-nitrite reductase large subunit